MLSSMRSATRFLLAAWMSLALPLQGIAAATMLHCGERPAEGALTADHAMAPDAPCHGAGAKKAAKKAAKQDGACDSCASCAAFSTVAMVPYLPPVGAQAPALRIPYSRPLPAVRVPDGLERPPRTSHA
ncbi:hypothetical protein BWI17_12100 [Betaproteobacteria bacterium GR16-43]|nr:hypothetical protein BWI17_12100 [Betaproteobacteria bacterium GR16-43]